MPQRVQEPQRAMKIKEILEDPKANAELQAFRGTIIEKFSKDGFEVLNFPQSDNLDINDKVKQVFGDRYIKLGTYEDSDIILCITKLTNFQLSTEGLFSNRFADFHDVYNFLKKTLPNAKIIMFGDYSAFTQGNIWRGNILSDAKVISNLSNYFSTIAFAGEQFNNLTFIADVLTRLTGLGINMIKSKEFANIEYTIKAFARSKGVVLASHSK